MPPSRRIPARTVAVAAREAKVERVHRGPGGDVRTRVYGDRGPLVVLLHGGPGAAGHMAPVARGLADAFRVLEPFQRRSGPEPLTVARHVADLRALLEKEAAGERTALVGSSWGAMLALAFAAAHPDLATPLVLVGCGTFDRGARAEMEATIRARTDEALGRRLAQAEEEIPDPDERLAAIGEWIRPLYLLDPISAEVGEEAFDARGHRETWEDMLRLQAEGLYPAAFGAITAPVLMLHGAFDPHPGQRIRDGLLPHLPHLEYREWERCGHYPWLERAVREEFFAVLRAWLARHLAPA